MKNFQLAFLLLAATIGVVHADAPGQSNNATGREQVQRVVDTFRASIITKDKTTLGSLFMPVGSSWVKVIGDEMYQRMKVKHPDVTKTKAGNYEDFVKFVGASPKRLEQKISNVRIDTDGAIASVYFDYVFLADDKESNRGNETWQLVNTGDGWKISALSYSVNSAAVE
jgi:hypothetical protein